MVPMSTGNTKKLITMMVDFGVTGIMCTPSYLLHIAETIEEMGVKDKIKLKASINGAEPWTEKMRTQIERQLGIHAHDISTASARSWDRALPRTASSMRGSIFMRTISCRRSWIRIH